MPKPRMAFAFGYSGIIDLLEDQCYGMSSSLPLIEF